MTKYNILKEFHILDENMWATVARTGADIANNGYRANMAAGAGYGAIAGAVGNVAKNALKRDDDPTKKGFFKSAVSGALGGSITGATIGAGARFAARTNLGLAGIDAAGKKAIEQARSGLEGAKAEEAARKVADYMNSGKKTGLMHRSIAFDSNTGQAVKIPQRRPFNAGRGQTRGSAATELANNAEKYGFDLV